MGCLICSSHKTSFLLVNSWTTWTSREAKAVPGSSIIMQPQTARMIGSTTFMVKMFLRMIRPTSQAIEQVREQVQTLKLQMNSTKELSCFPKAFQSHPRCSCSALKSSLTSMRTQLAKLIQTDQSTIRIWWVGQTTKVNRLAARTIRCWDPRRTRPSKWSTLRLLKWSVGSHQL